MNPIIQARDIEILKFVFCFRVVSYAQIRRRFFPTQVDSAFRRRLARLRKAGLLTSLYCNLDQKPHKCVSITESGCALIRNAFGFELDRPHWKSESPEHDLRLAEVHEKLSKLRLFSDFKTENQLQSATAFGETGEFRALVNLQPDGVLTLVTEKGSRLTYAIELEVSRKSFDRYQKKLQSYYQMGGVQGVFYICATSEIMNVVAKADQAIRTNEKSFVFVVLEESVLKNQGKIFLRNVDEHGIGIY